MNYFYGFISALGCIKTWITLKLFISGTQNSILLKLLDTFSIDEEAGDWELETFFAFSAGFILVLCHETETSEACLFITKGKKVSATFTNKEKNLCLTKYDFDAETIEDNKQEIIRLAGLIDVKLLS